MGYRRELRSFIRKFRDMKIENIQLRERPLLLAPMEDVSDPPFRVICRRYGADLVYTEFVSAGGLVHEARSSMEKLFFSPEERPVAIQIFGGRADYIRKAAEVVEKAAPDIIDINFGCPVKKVIKQGAGAGILRDIPKMRQLTEIVVAAARRPVTVKTRLGWDDSTIHILETARMLEDCGISALAVHARTRTQGYKGKARWEWLRKIKEEGGLGIPLIGNGDVSCPEDALRMFEETGVDAVMIGRAALGNPWVFREVRHFLETGEHLAPPSWEEKREVITEHLSMKCEWQGEKVAVLEMRKMYAGYLKGFRGAAALRNRLMEEKSREGVINDLENAEVES